MLYNYSNYTQFGIKNEAERYSYIGWQVFVVLCSFVGNTTILIASIKYQAFTLNEIVVAFIQNIAICNLFIAFGNVLPVGVSLMANSGGSSKILNYSRFFVSYYGNYVCASLIAAMALSKLILLKYPLRAGAWSKRHAHYASAAICLALFPFPALHLLVDNDDVIFDYRVYACMYQYSAKIWNIWFPILILIVIVVPHIIIIVSTILLLKEARKVVRGTRESLRWQGIMIEVLTAAVYTVSSIPLTVYGIVEPFVEKNQSTPGIFHVEYFRLAAALTAVNVVANFFVYSLTVTSFRRFLSMRSRKTFTCLTNKIPCKGNDPSKINRFKLLGNLSFDYLNWLYKRWLYDRNRWFFTLLSK